MHQHADRIAPLLRLIWRSSPALRTMGFIFIALSAGLLFVILASSESYILGVGLILAPLANFVVPTTRYSRGLRCSVWLLCLLMSVIVGSAMIVRWSSGGALARHHDQLVYWSAPVFVVMLAFTIAVGIRSQRRAIRRIRSLCGLLCPSCGYDLTRLPEQGECPECGAPYTTESLAQAWKPWLHR